jgi:hypothetical protein
MDNKKESLILKIFTGVLLILAGIIYYLKDFVYAFFVEMSQAIDVSKILALIPILIGVFCIYKFFKIQNRLILPVGIFLFYYGIIQMFFTAQGVYGLMLTSMIFIVPSATLLIFYKYDKTQLYLHLGVFLLTVGIGLVLRTFLDMPIVNDSVFYWGLAFVLTAVIRKPNGKAMFIFGIFLMVFSLKGLLEIDGVANAIISLVLVIAGICVIVKTVIDTRKRG